MGRGSINNKVENKKRSGVKQKDRMIAVGRKKERGEAGGGWMREGACVTTPIRYDGVGAVGGW